MVSSSNFLSLIIVFKPLQISVCFFQDVAFASGRVRHKVRLCTYSYIHPLTGRISCDPRVLPSVYLCYPTPPWPIGLVVLPYKPVRILLFSANHRPVYGSVALVSCSGSNWEHKNTVTFTTHLYQYVRQPRQVLRLWRIIPSTPHCVCFL